MRTATRVGLTLVLVALWGRSPLVSAPPEGLFAARADKPIREVTVRLLGDEELSRRSAWRPAAAAVISAVSADLERQFGIRLVVQDTGVWTSNDSLTSLDLLFDPLMSQTGTGGRDVLLALTGQSNLGSSPHGFSFYQEGVILAAYSSDRAELGRLLKHEWGHMFGAVHVADPGSVMSHFVRGTEFDPLNAAVIALNKDRVFNGTSFPLQPANRKAAAAIYDRIAKINRDLHEPKGPGPPRSDERSPEHISEIQKSIISQEVLVEPEAPDRPADRRRRNAFLFDDAHVLLAQILIEERDSAKALAECGVALELDPGNVETRNLQGIALRQLRRYDESIAVYRGLLRDRPGSARVLYNLGIVLDKAGDLDQAEASYRRSLELRGNFAEAWNNLGELLVRAGRLAEAENAFMRSAAANDRFAPAHVNLGEACVRDQEYEKAAAELDLAVRLDPSLPGAHNARGNLLRRQGRGPEAIAEYSRALEIDPNYEKAWYNLGLCRFDDNDLAGAESDFRKAVACRADFAEAHAGLGYCLLKNRKVPEGVAELELAEKLGASAAEISLNLSCAYLLTNRFDAAAVEARKAMAADPALALAPNNLGIALTRQGKLGEAADSFRQACRLDPRYKDAFANLGALLAVQGKTDEAADALLQAAAIDPKDGDIHNRLAVLYLRKGESAKAREHARQARALGAAIDPALAEELAKIR